MCQDDGDLHENPTEIRLDALIGRMVLTLSRASRSCSASRGLTVIAKPLAAQKICHRIEFTRENALHYGERAEICVTEKASKLGEIQIRDHGPGVPEEANPVYSIHYVRLEHGKRQNSNGMGSPGLGIAQGIRACAWRAIAIGESSRRRQKGQQSLCLVSNSKFSLNLNRTHWINCVLLVIRLGKLRGPEPACLR